MRITTVNITPVAVQDPPLLNSMGLHQPYALRAIIEVATDEGTPQPRQANFSAASITRMILE